MLDSDEMNMIKKINQELQEEAWRKDGVLGELLTFYYDKTFTELWSLQVLHDSRKRYGRKIDSSQ